MSDAMTTSSLREQGGQFSVRRADGGQQITITIVGSGGFAERDAGALVHELNVLASRGRQSRLISILRGVNNALEHEEDPSHSSLTSAELDALRAAGSLVEPESELPIEERPSVRTALRQQEILEQAMPTDEVAGLLGVSTSRVRQRNADRTLFAIPGPSRGLRFPRFQFTEQGELPGWGVVSRVLPKDANPVALEYFLTHTHPDFADGELTPVQWLAAGKPAESVAALAEQTFSIR